MATATHEYSSTHASSDSDNEIEQELSTKETSTPAPDSPHPKTLILSYHVGDIFSAPPSTLLIHACNTQGSWGAGIALEFKKRYPQAYAMYRTHCLTKHSPTTDPVHTGTALLIPPCETSPDAPEHWIGCLFTSARYGKGKDRPEQILANTGPAMMELLEKVREVKGERVAGVRMCKINSARFGVPWERTVEVLEGLKVEEDWKGAVEVWSIG